MNFAFLKAKLRNLSWLPQRSSHLRLGAKGERAAARYLRKRKHRILARNYLCPYGEIDLVSSCDGFIVFVEVKTRTDASWQDPLEIVNEAKWRRVHRAAQAFLTRCVQGDPPCRFDLITVVWPKGSSASIEHFESAYEPG